MSWTVREAKWNLLKKYGYTQSFNHDAYVKSGQNPATWVTGRDIALCSSTNKLRKLIKLLVEKEEVLRLIEEKNLARRE